MLSFFASRRHVGSGSNASVEPPWHIGFSPDSGHIAARQGTDASAKTGSRRFALPQIADLEQITERFHIHTPGELLLGDEF
jgi:hypothetical protein